MARSFSHLNFYLVGDVARLLELLLEILVLPLVVPTVWDGLSSYLRVGYPGIFPLSDSGVVVNKEDPAVSVDSLLPTLRQGSKIILVPPVRNIALAGEGGGAAVPGIHPGGLLGDVVDKEDPAIGSHLHRPARGKSFTSDTN